MITCRAHAKLNLCLAVSPPEPVGSTRAGWHRIASWFAPVALWDDLSLAPTRGPSHYHRAWAPDAPRPTPIDWPEESDLAVRAHRLLEHLAGKPLPITLNLVKRIPTGGGLGGGSSDAAAVLRAVTALYQLPHSPADLRSHSRSLGSDVAFFITDHPPGIEPPPPALVTGFGDEISPAGSPRGPLLLLFPDFGCPTPQVYRAFDALGPRPFRAEDVSQLADPRSPWPGAGLFNDLAPAAESVEPRLATLRTTLEDAGHTVHMTGSGSTLFILGDAPLEVPPGCTAVRTAFA